MPGCEHSRACVSQDMSVQGCDRVGGVCQSVNVLRCEAARACVSQDVSVPECECARKDFTYHVTGSMWQWLQEVSLRRSLRDCLGVLFFGGVIFV